MHSNMRKLSQTKALAEDAHALLRDFWQGERRAWAERRYRIGAVIAVAVVAAEVAAVLCVLERWY